MLLQRAGWLLTLGTLGTLMTVTHGLKVRCGRVEVNSENAICCNGLTYVRSGYRQACCGNVAYDAQHFMCCDDRTIVRRNGNIPRCCGGRRYDALTSECVDGYINRKTRLGSTCCQTDDGWKCCANGESCCRPPNSHGSGGSVEIPGFRPSCCNIRSIGVKAGCCARTTESVGAVPPCCEDYSVRPICCWRGPQSEGYMECCPITIGYCCGRERPPIVPVTTKAPYYRPRPGGRHPSDRNRGDPRGDIVPDHHQGRDRPYGAHQRGDRESALRGQTSRSYETDRSTGRNQPTDNSRDTGRNQPTDNRRQWDNSRQVDRDTGRNQPTDNSRDTGRNQPTDNRRQWDNSRQVDRDTGRNQPTDNRRQWDNSRQVDRDIGRNQPTDNSRDTGRNQPTDNRRQWDNSRQIDRDTGRNQPTDNRRQWPNTYDVDREEDRNRNADDRRDHSGSYEVDTVINYQTDSRGQWPESYGVDREGRNWQSDDPASYRHPRVKPSHKGRAHNKTTRPRSNKKQVEVQDGNQAHEECDEDFISENLLCCAGKLRIKIGVKPTCCGTQAYDGLIFDCCDGEVRRSCDKHYKLHRSLWGTLL